MALVRWSPLTEMMDLQREMGRVFGRPFVSMFEEPARGLGFGPPMDAFSRESDLVLRLELPGIAAEDLDISLVDHTLQISGERKQEKEVREEDFYRRERSYGRFERSFPVPEKITEKDVEASYENGVLEVVIKGVVEKEEAKHIEVKSKGERQEIKGEPGPGASIPKGPMHGKMSESEGSEM